MNNQSLFKHVIFIGVDALGNFYRNTPTPNIDRIFAEGARTDYCSCTLPSISGECWTSIFTGVRPFYHHVDNQVIDFTPYCSEFPTIFRLIREAYPDSPIGSFVNWKSLHVGAIENDINITRGSYVYSDYLEEVDKKVTDEAINFIKKEKPVFCFIYLGYTDRAGHTYGCHSSEYYEAIREVDRSTGRIYETLQKAGMLEDTLLLLTTDHGQIGSSHGCFSPDETDLFFAASGKGIINNHSLNIKSMDTAPIICHALGIEMPKDIEGHLPANMFIDMPVPSHKPHSEPKSIYVKEEPINEDIASSIRCAFSFKNSTKPWKGDYKARFSREEKYGEFGAVVSRDNHITVPDLTFGTGSFSVSMLFQADELGKGRPALFGNKSWRKATDKGFMVDHLGCLNFIAADGNTFWEAFFHMPFDLTGNTKHFLLTVDREQNTVSCYANFIHLRTMSINEELKNSTLDSELPFTIGADADCAENSDMDFSCSDFIIFNKALSQNEISVLKEHYYYK